MEQQQQQQQQELARVALSLPPRTPQQQQQYQQLLAARNARSQAARPSPASAAAAATVATSISVSGRTIHHHGQSPTKGGVLPPLAVNPAQQQQHTPDPLLTTMNVNAQQLKQVAAQQQQQQQQQQSSSAAVLIPGLQEATAATLPAQVPTMSQIQTARPTSGGSSPGSAVGTLRQFERTSPILSQYSALLPQRSPRQSPDRPRKKIKLEEKPAATQEITHYRQLLCDEKARQLLCLKQNCMEHLSELYFLQCGYNLMDYHTWKKKPPPQLVQVFKSSQLDSDEEGIGQEKKINDEVRFSPHAKMKCQRT